MIYTIINSDNKVINPLIKCDTDPSFLLKEGETAISQSNSNRLPPPRRGLLYDSELDKFITPVSIRIVSNEKDENGTDAIENGESLFSFFIDRESSPNIQENDFQITSASISNFTSNNRSGSFTLTTSSVANLNDELRLTLNPVTIIDDLHSQTYILGESLPIVVI